jgi:hypothetical protein
VEGIQKHVPRQSTKLNEISERFNSKFPKRSKDPESDFLEPEELPRFGHDPQDDIDTQRFMKQDHIRFVSSVDSRPV